ncbi:MULTISPECIES: hypothetical protein [unclassified Duganella]|uniref:hypothetical protein n=1 Tax=unclassified Duganella TaxID=2636909 RepID=UPI000882EACF|nr:MULTISPECIES: hypothetical protein [unclassified Duganella]SDH06498.1 hypothetical protein SAMN05216320_109160 [Duganella sp. OV458]SDK19594.1 hypothetical protein SAMN05428973_109122 [Duganella sp. OV510]
MSQESIETTVARLDERFKGFQNLVVQMADDQRRMAESYEKLVENNSRVGLVEQEVIAVKESLRVIWTKLDAFADENTKSSQRWLWEIAKAVLAAGGAVLAAKLFGVHL